MESIQTIFFIMEMIGTVAFAISGVMVAIDNELDLMGALVLGCITAIGGGALRDVLLGKLPPVLFTNPRYLMVAIGVSLATFLIAYFLGDRFTQRMQKLDPFINVLDAVGLGIFVVVGVDASISMGYGDNVTLSLFVGTITGVGGGVFRDQLAGRVPVILKKRIYAVAAIAGAVLYYVLLKLNVDRTFSLFACSALIVALRLLATHYHWNLPKITKKQ